VYIKYKLKTKIMNELKKLRELCKYYANRIQELEKENKSQKEYIKHILEVLDNFKQLTKKSTDISNRVTSQYSLSGKIVVP